MNGCNLSETCEKFKNNKCLFPEIKSICIRESKLNFLYDKARLSKNQRLPIHLCISENDPDYNNFIKLKGIETNIVDYVNKGENIYIHSTICGNGKTAWSVKLLQSYLNAIWYKSEFKCRALFINVPKFLLDLKASISNPSKEMDQLKQDIFNADLVVWDEVATKTLTPYEHEYLLTFIDSRIDEGKANIYTSNMNADDLAERLGPRLYSRIVSLSEGNEIIFRGSDKRGLYK